MSDCFYSENSENLMSVSEPTRGGARVIFGEKSCIEQGIETVYSVCERGNLSIWKIIGYRNHVKNSLI